MALRPTPLRQLVIAGVAVLALVAAALSFGDADRIVLTNILVTLVFAYSWNLVGGVLGELSFVHAIFFGIGVYGVTLGNIHGWPGWAVVVGAPLTAVGLGWTVVAVGAVARLDGLSWFVATLVLTMITAGAVAQSSALGGSVGLIMPRLPWEPRRLVVAAVVLATAVALVNAVVIRSAVGRRWVAVRDEPVAAGAHGIDVVRERLLAYSLSAPLACAAGMISGLVTGFANPAVSLGVAPMVLVVLSVYIGGPGTVWGPLLGVGLLQGIGVVVRRAWDDPHLAEWALVLQYGIALVVVMVLFTRRPAPARPDRRRLVDLDAVEVGDRRGESAVPLIELAGIGKDYGGISVLEGVDLTFDSGSVVGLVGPNGAGKTTLLNVIAGQVTPSRGVVRFGERDVTGVSVARRSAVVRRGFQTPRVFAGLSVVDNVRVPLPWSVPRAARLLESLGVGEWSKRARVATTSERRMVELAWAAGGAQPWALFDEPLAGLDDDEIAVVLQLIRRLADSGMGVVVVEHRLAEIVPHLDRMVVLDLGHVIADDHADAVLRSRRVIDAYLGTAWGGDG